MAIQLHCGSCGRQFRVKEQFRGTRIRCPGCRAEVTVQGPHVHGYDAFVSYSSLDKQVADAVCAAMESRGVRCWIAPRDIPPGASWASAIIDGIEDSRVLVLVFSAHANESDQVAREVAQAVAKGVPIVPLRIDRTPMRKDFSYFLGTCHWLDAADAALDGYLAQLTSTVRGMLLDRAAAEDAGPVVAGTVSPPTSPVSAAGAAGPAVAEALPGIDLPPRAAPARQTTLPPRGGLSRPLKIAAAAALLVAAAASGWAVRHFRPAGAPGATPAAGAGLVPATAATRPGGGVQAAEQGWVDLFNG